MDLVDSMERCLNVRNGNSEELGTVSSAMGTGIFSGRYLHGVWNTQRTKSEAIKQDRRYETRMVRHPCDRCTSSWAMKESDELVVCMGCGTKVVREKAAGQGTDKSGCERCRGSCFRESLSVYCGFGRKGWTMR